MNLSVLEKKLWKQEICERIETIQTTAPLNSARILRRVLETRWSLLSLRLLWKTLIEWKKMYLLTAVTIYLTLYTCHVKEIRIGRQSLVKHDSQCLNACTFTKWICKQSQNSEHTPRTSTYYPWIPRKEETRAGFGDFIYFIWILLHENWHIKRKFRLIDSWDWAWDLNTGPASPSQLHSTTPSRFFLLKYYRKVGIVTKSFFLIFQLHKIPLF